ncbi:MAG: hypothetical protein B6I34_06715 [Anaerolineaceae bacterium 4572_32.1]|nr:MAG: hypothetical protein B6I34_06715 [Anaerolineaceae bacterium 4572_32.1]
MNARNKALLAGGMLGALLGLLAAWIYVRDLEEGQESQVEPADALKLGLSALGFLRQVAGLTK